MDDAKAHDKIAVRTARRQDLAAAAKLAAELVRQHNAYDPLRFMTIEPLEEGYERFLGTQVDRDDVYVDASVRRRGVASHLVEEAVLRLSALGAPRVVLMAAWRNEGARRLFDRLGFRPTMLELTREAKPRV